MSLETGRLGHAKSNPKGSKLKMYVTPLASTFCPGTEKKAQKGQRWFLDGEVEDPGWLAPKSRENTPCGQSHNPWITTDPEVGLVSVRRTLLHTSQCCPQIEVT